MKIFLSVCSIILSSCCLAQGVDSLSVVSLKIELYNSNDKLSTATGFVVEKNNKYYLITNLHVVTGKDYYSNTIIDPQLRVPNIIAVWQNTQALGHWTRIAEPLYSKKNEKRWIECSIKNKTMDLVALPLENIPKEVKFYPFLIGNYSKNLYILPGFSTSIVGFPYGMASDGSYAIWKTGHIASDLDIDSNGLPMFMIDATTKPGMSGSLVVIRMSPYIVKNSGTHIGVATDFLGIYTAQSSTEEIGYVLKPIVLKTLMDNLP